MNTYTGGHILADFRVAVVTSTRAEYGLLKPVIDSLLKHKSIETLVVATGAHLMASQGYTLSEIEEDGISVYTAIDIFNDDVSDEAVSVANTITMFSAWFRRESPDLVVLLGDRYEIFGVATAASICRIPIAHISGGETTEGAKDEFYRHCITKMSAIHFPSTEKYRTRVIQLGEDPANVYNVGSLGAQNVLSVPLMKAEELSDSVGFDFSRDFLLCTCHSETLGSGAGVIYPLLEALDSFGMPVLFTAANADEGGDIINSEISSFCETHKQCKLVSSLGYRRFLSALKLTKAAVGNSSSSLTEAPAMRKPSVNIGLRQRGRDMAGSVISCSADKDAILNALSKAVSDEFGAICETSPLPFKCEGVSDSIAGIIEDRLRKGIDTVKTFYDIPKEEK